MKFISAVDSFKGCLSSTEVNNSIEKGIKKVFDNCEVIKISVADGGEGTIDSLIEILGGEKVKVKVLNPINKEIDSYYGILKDKNTAVIEMAVASGLPLLKKNERNPMKTSTYGTGQLIKDALLKGCTRFIVGIGGSATNDGGMGMLEALGYKFYDINNNYLDGKGENLIKINKIEMSPLMLEYKNLEFTIACDVNNPFYGKNGASYVYAKQKGATDDMIIALDKGLEHFARVIERDFNINIQSIPGSGAAGGIGGAFVSFLKGQLNSGIDIILETIDFENIISKADLIFTGEGRIDFQTSMGKAPVGIAKYAKKQNIPVIAIAGSIGQEAKEVNNHGIDSFFSIMNSPMTLSEAMDRNNSIRLIEESIEQICRLLKISKKFL